MFYPPERLAFTRELERHVQVIRSEFHALAEADFVPQVETDLYNDDCWRVVPMFIDRDVEYVQQKCREGRAKCPRTAALLQGMPGCIMATFSKMMPGTHILPHAGTERGIYRCHLCLQEAPACGLAFGDDVRTWRDGEFLVFEDTVFHEAWNRGDQERVVLMADFLKACYPLQPDGH